MLDRVFVAHDVITNVKLVEATLSSENFDGLLVYRVPQEQKNIKTEPSDIVLLDVMTLGMDGFEVGR